MSADPNACYCGGDSRGHVVGCPASTPGLVWIGVDLSSKRDRVVLRCGCGSVIDLDGDRRLLAAALMVHEVRPENWDDDDDPDQVAAWSALEEALRANGGLPPATQSVSREALDGMMP